MGLRGRKGGMASRMDVTAGEVACEDRPAPRILGKEGRRLWNELMANHPKGHFASGDWPLVEAYCLEYQRYLSAVQHIADEGEVIETRTTVKRNPWHDVLTTSANLCIMLAMKLRLCANARLTQKQAGDVAAAEQRQASTRAGLMFGGPSEDAERLQ